MSRSGGSPGRGLLHTRGHFIAKERLEVSDKEANVPRKVVGSAQVITTADQHRAKCLWLAARPATPSSWASGPSAPLDRGLMAALLPPTTGPAQPRTCVSTCSGRLKVHGGKKVNISRWSPFLSVGAEPGTQAGAHAEAGACWLPDLPGKWGLNYTFDYRGSWSLISWWPVSRQGRPPWLQAGPFHPQRAGSILSRAVCKAHGQCSCVS